MAILNVTQLSSLIGTGNSSIPVPAISGATSEDVAFGNQSTAFAEDTRFLLLVADEACRVKVGANPTATSTDTLLPANVPFYFGVNRGEKISAIALA